MRAELRSHPKQNFPVYVIGALLALPFVLFAFGVLTPFHFVVGFIAAVFLAVFVVNFEVGFLTLIFVRSSLDYFRQFAEGLNIAGIVSLLLVVLGLFYILYRRIRIFTYEETRPFLIFLAAAGVSVFFSESRIDTVSDWLRLFSIFFVYIFARHIASSPKKIRPVLILVLLSALVPVVVAFVQMAFGSGRHHGRLNGTFYHPNAFASYLLILLIVVASQIFEKKSILPRRLLLPFAFLTFLAFVWTFSRGAWIVFILAMLILGVFRYRRILLIVPAALVLVVAVFSGVQERIRDVTDPSFHRGRSGWEWRLDAWNEILPIVREKPVFGYGLGMVNVEFGFMAHNDYLRLAAEAGLVGLLAYLGLMISVLRRTWWDYKNARSDLVKSFQLGLLAMIAAFLVREVADNTLRNTVVLLYFWLLIAMARSMALAEQKGELPS